MSSDEFFQLAHHYDTAPYPEWGSAPRRPLIVCDMAHRGELMESVVGQDAATGAPMVYHVLRCELCIAIHLWPIPDEEALTQFYAREFYETAKPAMITEYEEDADWWSTCTHGPVLDTAVMALKTAPVYASRILDIGAGPGLLLRHAQERGWCTHAIEPSPVCAARLRRARHGVWEGSLSGYMQADTTPRSYYDIVTMWETLEHLPCPEDALLHVYDLLKPGGIVAICVPNDYTPQQIEACQQFGLQHWWVVAPQHIWQFSPKTLQLLLRRCGFQQCQMRMTFPLIETFILEQGRCYVGNPALGRACHQERMRFELEMVQRGQWGKLEATYIANVAQRRGREIIAVFQKPVEPVRHE